MSKNAVTDWDEAAANNTDIGGVGIANSSSIRLGNDAIQEMMAQLAELTGADTIASATTTDLSTVPGSYVSVSGTTTITGLGTVKAGTIKFLKFEGALTLTHNGTSLILPDGKNIVVAAGDTATFVSEGSGNWRCLDYRGREWVTFQSVTISNQATVDLTGWPSDAKIVEIIFDSVAPVTDAQNLIFRTSSDGGSTFAAASGDYRYSHLRSTVGGSVVESGSASDTRIVLSSAVGNQAGETVSGFIRLYTPGDAKRCTMTYQCDGVDNSGNGFTVTGGGARRTDADVDAARFLFPSGNANSGKVYGRYFR